MGKIATAADQLRVAHSIELTVETETRPCRRQNHHGSETPRYYAARCYRRKDHILFLR
jgi:hypothetical protein